jgi:hypothetical protein
MISEIVGSFACSASSRAVLPHSIVACGNTPLYLQKHSGACARCEYASSLLCLPGRNSSKCYDVSWRSLPRGSPQSHPGYSDTAAAQLTPR